jgi:predicted DCC family thiol-disulfide oxidoreductase YuxK
MAGSGDPVVVLYDAGCAWCRWSVAKVLAFDLRRLLQPEPIQGELGRLLLDGMPEAQQLASAHAVTPDGQVFSGGDAAVPIAAVLPVGAALAALLRAFGGATRAAYALIAGNRSRLGRLVTPAMLERADVCIARHRWNAARRGRLD